MTPNVSKVSATSRCFPDVSLSADWVSCHLSRWGGGGGPRRWRWWRWSEGGRVQQSSVLQTEICCRWNSLFKRLTHLNSSEQPETLMAFPDLLVFVVAAVLVLKFFINKTGPDSCNLDQMFSWCSLRGFLWTLADVSLSLVLEQFQLDVLTSDLLKFKVDLYSHCSAAEQNCLLK